MKFHCDHPFRRKQCAGVAVSHRALITTVDEGSASDCTSYTSTGRNNSFEGVVQHQQVLLVPYVNITKYL